MNLKKEIVKIPLVENIRTSYNRYWNNRNRTSNVAMMHIGRVGSTVLGDMMNQHSKIFWDGEPFERIMRSNKDHKKEFVQDVIKKSMQKSRSEIYCFATKFMPEQHLWRECINMDLENYIALLRRLNYTKFIFIKRDNYLKQVVSVLVGRKKKLWHSNTQVDHVTKVKIDVNNYAAGYGLTMPLIEYFEHIDKQYERLDSLLKSDEKLVLIYENDIEKDPNIAYRKICNFLTIHNANPKITYKKTNPFLLADLIENFDEVKTALKNTKFEEMLN